MCLEPSSGRKAKSSHRFIIERSNKQLYSKKQLLNTPLPYKGQQKINACLYTPIKKFSLVPTVSNFGQSQARNNTQRQARQKPNCIVRNGDNGKYEPQKVNGCAYQKRQLIESFSRKRICFFISLELGHSKITDGNGCSIKYYKRKKYQRWNKPCHVLVKRKEQNAKSGSTDMLFDKGLQKVFYKSSFSFHIRTPFCRTVYPRYGATFQGRRVCRGGRM